MDFSGLDSETGVVVPEYECPLTLVDPADPNISDEQLYIVCYENIKQLRTQT